MGNMASESEEKTQNIGDKEISRIRLNVKLGVKNSGRGWKTGTPKSKISPSRELQSRFGRRWKTGEKKVLNNGFNLTRPLSRKLLIVGAICAPTALRAGGLAG